MAESTVEERRARYERVLGVATQFEKFSAVEIQREAFENAAHFRHTYLESTNQRRRAARDL